VARLANASTLHERPAGCRDRGLERADILELAAAAVYEFANSRSMPQAGSIDGGAWGGKGIFV
jgi:hypothetical protein